MHMLKKIIFFLFPSSHPLLQRIPVISAHGWCLAQKQRLTVVAARFFDYGLRGTHLKTVGMALQVGHVEQTWIAFVTVRPLSALKIFDIPVFRRGSSEKY